MAIYYSGCVWCVFLDEINIQISRLVKQTAYPNVGGTYPINEGPEQKKKAEDREVRHWCFLAFRFELNLGWALSLPGFG